MKIQIGKPFPLGAVWDGEGINFAIFSENAESVELCLFNSIHDNVESEKINFTERSGPIWHIYISGIGPGQLYAYRIGGKYEPHNGNRFNKNKLLIDPNTKAIAGDIKWDDSLFGYEVGNEKEDLSFSNTDSCAFIPKCVVINTEFDWENVQSPEIPYHKTIIYEAHVKGLTKLNDKIPENIRGTYAGIAHPEMIGYLTSLGITTIELMPVHFFLNDRFLEEKNLTNYWGYN